MLLTGVLRYFVGVFRGVLLGGSGRAYTFAVFPLAGPPSPRAEAIGVGALSGVIERRSEEDWGWEDARLLRSCAAERF